MYVIYIYITYHKILINKLYILHEENWIHKKI